MADYTKLEIWYEAFKADGSAALPITNQYNNDIFVEVYDSAAVSKGQFGYNASGILQTTLGEFGGLYSALTADMKAADFSGSGGKFTLKIKYGTNTAASAGGLITKYVIKSAKLIAAD